ncbi:hypothetical protein KXD40_004483 [Peronospora effusa]|nr:hypothetical protein KXD40_004483 [Peronospora effusa]
MRTFLVLILATLSSSYFSLAERNVKIPLPSSLQAHLENADGVLAGLQTHLETADAELIAKNDQTINDKIKDELTKLANTGEGQEKLSKEQVNSHLNKYLENIENDPWLKTPEGATYKETVKETVEVIAKNPSKLPWWEHALNVDDAYNLDPYQFQSLT